MKRQSVVISAFTALLIVACQHHKPEMLTHRNVDGQWNGNVKNTSGDVLGTVHLDFVQNGSDLSGSYTIDGSSTGIVSNGRLTGTYNENTGAIEFDLSQQTPCIGSIPLDGNTKGGEMPFQMDANTSCYRLTGGGQLAAVKPTRIY